MGKLALENKRFVYQAVNMLFICCELGILICKFGDWIISNLWNCYPRSCRLTKTDSYPSFQGSSIFTFRLSPPYFLRAPEALSLEMRQQHRAFTSLPHRWKWTSEKSPDICLSSFPSPHLHSSPCPALTLHPLPCVRSPLSLSLLYPYLNGLLRFLFLVWLLPCPAQAAWFQVGVVGPWGCDPLFAKALPSVAAQLAVNRINRDPSLSYGTTFDYVVLQVPHK